MNQQSDPTAAELLDVMPLVMRTIKLEMRSRRAEGLSVPQFRAMLHVNRQTQTSLTEVAEHLGLTSATTCRMIDDLVERGLVLSRPSTIDRRKIVLSLTGAGQANQEAARRGTLARLEELLAPLTADERAAVVQAMHILQSAFAPEPNPET
jgi:DNA-binding MarR family transcriptional regulator